MQCSSCIHSYITTHCTWKFVLMSHLPLPSNLPVTQTSSVGLFFPECDSDQCLRSHWSLHHAPDEDTLYEIRAHLFHRSCHWHAVLQCHPAAPARGLPSIHIPTYIFYLHIFSHTIKLFLFFFFFILSKTLKHRR